LPSGGSLPATNDIVEAVQRSLETAAIINGTTDWCMVVEHNDGGTTTATYTTGTCGCDLGENPALPSTTPATTYVRVTVCVPLTAVAPNLLSFCGLDFSSNTVQQQTTFLYGL
jgi:hypothetical protein